LKTLPKLIESTSREIGVFFGAKLPFFITTSIGARNHNRFSLELMKRSKELRITVIAGVLILY
jgi:hypothetical protein